MKKNLYAILILIIVFFGVLQKASAQFNLVIDQCATNEEVIALVDTVFLSGMNTFSVRNIEFTGDPSSIGYFRGGYLFGFDRPEGIVMSNGLAGDLDESNTCSSANASTITSGLSDPDLNALSGQNITDVCIIEFDFKPVADSAIFTYVFGSEDYHDYVGSQFIDVFGFFLSGPGIEGAFSNDAINIALVPGTSIPVSANSVNCGTQEQYCTPPSGGGSNCEYLIDNTINGSSAFQQLALDAYTTPFHASNTIQSNEWFHMKLAIGDATDGVLDSGVFLEKGSFYTGTISDVDGGELYQDNSGRLEAYLFPNPAKDQITIGYTSVIATTYDIVVYNQIGQRVYTAQSTNNVGQVSHQINIENFQVGLYFIKMTTSSSQVYQSKFEVIN